MATDTEEYKANVSGEIQSGIIERNTRPPATVQYEVIDGLAIFEGDIILGRAEDIDVTVQPTPRAVVITGDQFRWRNGVVPFRIDPALPNQARVTNAIQHWEQNTSIRFVQRTTQADFITFRPGSGCSSAVGRQGGEQFINLASGCGQGSTIHEIGHAVALWHEQSREDRNTFVTINWSNIQAGKEHNFNQQISDGDDVGAYEYGSIMHYGAFAFAIDPSVPTIVAPQPIGQRNGLSAGDIAAIRRIYYFQRRGDSANIAGAVSDITAIRHRTQQVVTAVRTQSNSLKLISWQVNSNGSVSRQGDSGNQAGEASDLDIAHGSRYVVACRTGSGTLKLISWNVSDGGVITRAGDSGNQAGEASVISIVAMTDQLFVTACRTGGGNLKLISWRLNANGSLTRLADSANAAGAVSEISMVGIPSGGGGKVVTAVRTGSGTLKLIVWSVSAAGAVARLGDSGSQAGAATLIRSVRDSHGHILTSVRTGSGNLKLISWSISQDGHIVTRLGDSGNQAGDIGGNALMSRAPGVISAVRTGSGTLKLIAWQVSAAGQIARTGDSYNLAGEASLITLCQDSLVGNAPIVSAVRTASGDLKVITWDDEA